MGSCENGRVSAPTAGFRIGAWLASAVAAFRKESTEPQALVAEIPEEVPIRVKILSSESPMNTEKALRQSCTAKVDDSISDEQRDEAVAIARKRFATLERTVRLNKVGRLMAFDLSFGLLKGKLVVMTVNDVKIHVGSSSPRTEKELVYCKDKALVERLLDEAA